MILKHDLSTVIMSTNDGMCRVAIIRSKILITVDAVHSEGRKLSDKISSMIQASLIRTDLINKYRPD